MNRSHWIWYPGDFEIYHGMMQNFSREERGFIWPAYYHLDDCRKHVRFTREYNLEKEETVTVYANCLGYYRINDVKKRFGEPVVCGPGKQKFEIYAGMPSGVPSVRIEGETITSNRGWLADDFVSDPVPVGYNEIYTAREQDPSIWVYDEKEYFPSEIREDESGVLFVFETELTAILKAEFPKGFREMTLCYGESETEARDTVNCYYSQTLHTPEDEIIRRAFRYVFIPGVHKDEISIKAVHQYVDIPVRASFSSSDELVNKIWDVAVWTFQLCSGIFFIDGVKRDRWIWSGDAYQSYFVNQYLMFDEDINRRTLWALIGNSPIRQHINTIVDYSMYWVIGILNHYRMTGDEEFVKAIYPRMTAMMEFLGGQLDENGFIVGREGDWIFVDWADMDKEGAICAEQMLLAMCYQTMAQVDELVLGDGSAWEKKYQALASKIEKFYWNEEKGAYIDSFSSGKNNVTRHANIFAILFGFADDARKELLMKNVIENDKIPQITTPYFKFYELEAMCAMGRFEDVKKMMESYWGGMLSQGAVTFWEEFDPEKKPEEQYEMYGDPFGKSFCHAWAASPIYLLGRYFAGIQLTDTAYKSFTVKPETDTFESVDCTFPVKGGTVHVKWDEKILSVESSVSGGTLIYCGKEYLLEPGKTVTTTK